MSRSTISARSTWPSALAASSSSRSSVTRRRYAALAWSSSTSPASSDVTTWMQAASSSASARANSSSWRWCAMHSNEIERVKLRRGMTEQMGEVREALRVLQSKDAPPPGRPFNTRRPSGGCPVKDGVACGRPRGPPRRDRGAAARARADAAALMKRAPHRRPDGRIRALGLVFRLQDFGSTFPLESTTSLASRASCVAPSRSRFRRCRTWSNSRARRWRSHLGA